MKSPNQLSPAVVALIVIALIGTVTAGAVLLGSDQEDSSDNRSSSLQSSQNTTNDKYQDGTYQATGQYFSPGGRESITLSLTINNGTITDTSLTPNPTSGTARQFQEQFAAGYKAFVIGKDIDEVSLSRVAGSSLTSSGFNDALEQIKDDASA